MKTNALCYCKKSILALFFVAISAINCAEKIKLYAVYTPSHEQMMREYFLPSIQDDFDIILDFYNQECQSGNFMQAGWNKTMLHKVEIVIRGIKENWGNIFIHSDVDIQFFRATLPTILQAIQGKDIVCQQDNPHGILCGGFIVCRGNNKTLKLWEDIYQVLASAMNNTNDQILLNQLISRGQFWHEENNMLDHMLTRSCKGKKYNISWGFLPTTFMGGGTLTGHIWKPGQTLPVPHDIIMHHANYCVGVDHKMKQLAYVKRVVLNR